MIIGIDNDGKVITKTSYKGVQQKRNDILKSHMLNVLTTQNPKRFEISGFITNNGTIFTYTQEKQGLSYYCVKRKVLCDGVSTYDCWYINLFNHYLQISKVLWEKISFSVVHSLCIY